jgi:dynactin complex subunit
MKVNINVPDSLNEITLYQYQRFEKLIQENEASHFVNQKTIEIFCNIELKDVARIRIADIDDLLLHLNNLLQQKPKLTKTFKLGVYEFGFIPKLEDMTSGEFIDLENYLSSTESLHQAMAVLFRPIKSKVKDLYTIEEYESSYKYSEVLKYMPLDIALGSMLFFWTLQNDCVNALTDYIQNEVEQSEQAKQVLAKNGVGINQFTQQLKGIFSDSMPLLNYQSQN